MNVLSNGVVLQELVLMVKEPFETNVLPTCLRIFCECHHRWSSYGSFWLMLFGLGPNR